MNSIFDNMGAMPQAQPQATPNIMDMFNNPQATQGIQQISSMLEQVGNMQGGMDSLIPLLKQQNPQMAQMFEMIQNGGNPQQMVQDIFNKQGIPPEQQQQFIAELQQRMIKR